MDVDTITLIHTRSHIHEFNDGRSTIQNNFVHTTNQNIHNCHLN